MLVSAEDFSPLEPDHSDQSKGDKKEKNLDQERSSQRGDRRNGLDERQVHGLPPTCAKPQVEICLCKFCSGSGIRVPEGDLAGRGLLGIGVEVRLGVLHAAVPIRAGSKMLPHVGAALAA